MEIELRGQTKSMATGLPVWFDLNLKQEFFAKRNRRRGPLSFVDWLGFRALDRIVRRPRWKFVSPYHWSELEAYIEQDCRTIKLSAFRPDVVIGIKSGGAFIANYVALCLDVRTVGYVKVEHFTPILGSSLLTFSLKYFSTAKLLAVTNLDLRGLNVLLVDDQSCTGKSLMIARRWIEDRGAKEVRTYCIFSQGARLDFGGRDGIMLNCPWGDDP